MITKRAHKHSDMDQKQLQEHFRSKCDNLSDDKKQPLQQQAAAEHKQYAVDLYDVLNNCLMTSWQKIARDWFVSV